MCIVHESLYLLLGGDNEEPSSWSPLSFLSRVFLLRKTVSNFKRPSSVKTVPPSVKGASLVPCAYSWPWVAIQQRKNTFLHNVATSRRVNLQTGKRGKTTKRLKLRNIRLKSFHLKTCVMSLDPFLRKGGVVFHT